MFQRKLKQASTPKINEQIHEPVKGNLKHVPTWVKGLPLQPKLTINQPGDEYEQEADLVAEQVMRTPAGPAAGRVQRCACGGIAGPDGECEACKAKRLGLQRKGDGMGGSDAPPSVHETLRSSGQPLDVNTRTFMESRFGQEFGGVRVHADEQAARSATDVSARAYTVGNNVVFGAGAYTPGTTDGNTLIAHELAHVVQQQMDTPSRINTFRKEDWDFTPSEYGSLTKAGKKLRFEGDSNWFPAAFRNNLLTTLNSLLDPSRKVAATQGVNVKDFYHGHIAVKGKRPHKIDPLDKTYDDTKKEKYADALGGKWFNDVTTENLPAFKKALDATLPSATALLEAVAKLKDVVVIYHTFEVRGPAGMPANSPDRNFITPLNGTPSGYTSLGNGSVSSHDQEYAIIFQFSFLVDETGVIHVRTSTTTELSTVTGQPEN